ncbi:MAG: TIGR00725 family protein [Candidatus Aadella gelida]|nr:TIGR00725 family protein [Candidatus Aadella gelida]
MKKILVSVIGGHKCDEKTAEVAEKVGKIIAEEGAVLVSGGLAGVMEAANRGAVSAGGLTVGIIPGNDKSEANEFVNIVITTGIGYARNTIVATGSDIVVALPGEYGTLSEIGFALSLKKKVYGLGSWEMPEVIKLESPEELREVISGLK